MTMDWPFHVEPLHRLLVDVGIHGPIAALSVQAADLVLARFLAKELRRTLRFSVALSWLYIAISAARCFTPGDSDIDLVFRVLAAIALAFACAQTLFVLAVDFVLGRNNKKPLRPLIRYGLLGITFFVAALIGLRAGGVTTLGVLASGAVVIGGVGAAVAEVLKQVGAGILVQYARPFDVGDVIQVMPSERRGKVVSTNWRSTVVRGPDGVEFLTPNADIVTNTMINYGHGDRPLRRQIDFDATYATPPDRVRRAVLPALRDVDGLEATPPPEVLLADYKDSGVNYVVRYWTRNVGDYERVDADVRARVWYAFARAGLEFPFPMRTLQLVDTAAKQADETLAVAEPLRNAKMFATLDEPKLRDVASLGREEPFSAGEIIVEAGEVGTTMHVILEGEVAVQAPLDRRELFRLSAGDFFGEMSLVTGALRTATVVTTLPTRTFVIDTRAFQAIVARHPEVLDALSEIIAVRQTDLNAAIDSSKAADSQRSRHIKSLIMDRLKGLFSFGGSSGSSGSE